MTKIAKTVRAVFNCRISYAAGTWEDVEWDKLPFDIAAMNIYLNSGNREEVLKRISDLRKTGRPVWVTEFGSCTYQGAFQYGATAYEYLDYQPYSQEEQAAVIEVTLLLLNSANVNACFLWKYKAYKTDDRGNYGILKFDGARFNRKPSFYIYQSYVPIVQNGPRTFFLVAHHEFTDEDPRVGMILQPLRALRQLYKLSSYCLHISGD